MPDPEGHLNVARLRERVKGARWTIYVCLEPDGEHCDSGTHPNVCRHSCAALKRWHESGGASPAPVVAAVEVGLVGMDKVRYG